MGSPLEDLMRRSKEAQRQRELDAERQARSVSPSRLSSPPLPPMGDEMTSQFRQLDPSNPPPEQPLTPLPLVPALPLFPALPSKHYDDLGERILKRVKLESVEQGYFRQFAQMSDVRERDMELMAQLLHNNTLLQKASENSSKIWEPPKKLKGWVKKYVHAIILLPNTRLFAGNLTAIIIQSMRASKIPGVPGKDDEEEAKFVSYIGRQLSLFRNTVKKQISTATSSTTLTDRNIASIASALCEGESVEPVLGLYMNLAFIRFHIIKYSHSQNEFWDNVDTGLETMRAGGSEAFLTTLNFTLEEDQREYGKISESGCALGKAVDSSSPAWLQKLSGLAPRIQPTKSGRKTSKKRSREMSEEAGDEGGEGGEGGDGLNAENSGSASVNSRHYRTV